MSSAVDGTGAQFVTSGPGSSLEGGSPHHHNEWQGWNSTNLRHLMSATLVLTLGIIGSAILPVASAFATTGAVLGIIIALVVGATNVYTCTLLIRGAQYTGTRDYESFSHAVGGAWYKFFTEFSIIVLFLGTIVGAMIQCGEVGSAGLLYTWPDSTPGWLTYRSGLVIVCFFTLFCIYPLSLLPNMRKLETVGGFGIIIIWFLMFVIIVYACKNGLPALKHDMFGGFATVNQGSVSDVANSFSLFGFAFYLQAIMMPLLGEMPPGRTGAKITNAASMVTVIGVAATTYIVTAFFGAAMYGYTYTSDNILSNQWFGSYTVLEDGTLVPGDGGAGQFVLNFLMTVYLAISLPPIVFAMCLPVNNWMVMATRGRYENLRPFTRQFINVTIIVAVCLAISLGAPGSSGDVLTVTGATGVCLVSYLIPVLSHLLLVFGKARCQRLDSSEFDSSAYGGATVTSRQPSSLEDGTNHSKKLEQGLVGDVSVSPMTDSATAPLTSDGKVKPLERVSFREPTLPGRVPERIPSMPIRERYSVNLDANEADNVNTPPAPGMERLGSDNLTMTQIGYFAMPREYHAPKHGQIYFWTVEVLIPIAVLSVGVLFSVATLVLLHQTISEGDSG